MGYAVAGESGVEARREKRINRCCGRIIADTSSGPTKTRTWRGKGTCAMGGNAFREISKIGREPIESQLMKLSPRGNELDRSVGDSCTGSVS